METDHGMAQQSQRSSNAPMKPTADMTDADWQNPDEWEDAGWEMPGRANPGAAPLLVVRLAPGEAETIGSAADREGEPIGAFVRRAALKEARRTRKARPA
jgi:hypothetical protein